MRYALSTRADHRVGNKLLLAAKVSIQAQSTDSTAFPVVCRALSSLLDDQQSSGPEIFIVTMKFSRALQMPISDQERIVSSIRLESHGDSVDGATEATG